MSLEIFSSPRVADNDIMSALNNNVNSCLKLVVLLGENYEDKKRETRNENKECPDFSHKTKLYYL